MNFLAHLYLSGESPEIMVGNFIGDFVKGSQINNFEDKIVRGIRIHRAIDAYTDSHETVKESKNRLKDRYRHYSGVIVDVYYDHFLATNWNDYHEQPLEHFVSQSYKTILEFDEVLPEKVKYVLSYMIPQNWLVSYREIDGIGQALSGLSRRTKFDSGMENAIIELKDHYQEFETEFKEFFKELIQYVNTLEEKEL